MACAESVVLPCESWLTKRVLLAGGGLGSFPVISPRSAPSSASRAFEISYLLRQPDLDWGDVELWKFAALGAVVGLVVTAVVLA